MIIIVFILILNLSNSFVFQKNIFSRKIYIASHLEHDVEAKTILSQPEGYGFISTLSRKKKTFHFPHSSLVGFSIDDTGNPFFAFSTLSFHTRNLILNNSASLCVPDYGFKNGADARVSLTGLVDKVYDESKSLALKNLYKNSHPHADWIFLPDFSIYKMNKILDISFVGGFKRAGPISIEKYYSARPDPLIFKIKDYIEILNDNYLSYLIEKLDNNFDFGKKETIIIKNLDCIGINFRTIHVNIIIRFTIWLNSKK